VAEDNDISRKLAVRVLEKLGHQVTAVEDGASAVSAMQQNPFDIVFMDVQMPGMDGFEATHRIREFERFRGGHVPIVAITAHAIEGYRQRCLDAGMDEYVTKPMRIQDLGDAIGRLCPDALLTAAVATPPPADLTDVLKITDGDRTLMIEIIDEFIKEYGISMDAMQRAVTAADAASLRHYAHRFKGAVSHFHAPRVYAPTAELESLAKDSRLEEARGRIARLEEAMMEVVVFLNNYRGEKGL
jgi:CheY-like chemotaxis protein